MTNRYRKGNIVVLISFRRRYRWSFSLGTPKIEAGRESPYLRINPSRPKINSGINIRTPTNLRPFFIMNFEVLPKLAKTCQNLPKLNQSNSAQILTCICMYGGVGMCTAYRGKWVASCTSGNGSIADFLVNSCKDWLPPNRNSTATASERNYSILSFVFYILNFFFYKFWHLFKGCRFRAAC